MKRNIRLLLLASCTAALLLGCSKDKEEREVEENDTKEQVAFDDVKVKDYTVLSYSELEVLAYEDDTKAQVMLGRMLEYGTEDVKQDFSEAISWYKMASDSGDYEGTCALGYFYLTGTGVTQDLKQAKDLFTAAINDGAIANAKVGLARVLLAEGGYQFVEEDTSISADESEDEEEEAPTSTSEDLEQVVTLITEAQKADDADAGYYLGKLYQYGIGVPQDYKKAFAYYSGVAASTSTAIQDRDSINLANVALGIMYVKGLGIEENPETALEYFTKASENGSAKASYYIGQIYENGIGVDKDYEQAMEFYLKAADMDYAPALNQVGYLYYNGYGVDVDFASAVYYQKLAALQGYAIAQVNLGFLYENGYGVERNLETALAYYEMAADSGYEGAMEAVVRVKAQINEET